MYIRLAMRAYVKWHSYTTDQGLGRVHLQGVIKVKKREKQIQAVHQCCQGAHFLSIGIQEATEKEKENEENKMNRNDV